MCYPGTHLKVIGTDKTTEGAGLQKQLGKRITSVNVVREM